MIEGMDPGKVPNGSVIAYKFQVEIIRNRLQSL